MENMYQSFIYRTDAWIISIALFILMLISAYSGRKFGLGRMKMREKGESSATGTVVTSMFGLLAFLLAFTFGMSGNRYDARRQHIVDEANAIGTAILRADLYSKEDRVAFRDDFQKYLEARIRYFELGTAVNEVITAKTSGDEYGKRIWDRTAQLSRDSSYAVASMQMVPAVNAMLDLSTTRLIAELSRVPDSIVYMLLTLSLASAFYLGYSSASSGLDWFAAAGFCLLTSVVIYITLDLDRPRRGFIHLSTPHQAMVELRKLF